MSKKFLITEEDRLHIRSMYGLISEEIDPNTGGSVTIQNYYKPGFYTLDSTDTQTNQPVKNKLTTALEEVTEFVKKNPDSIVEVKFISQESAIPNKDNEGKEGGNFMDVGGLSDVRKKYIEPYIQTYFNNLKAQGIIPQSVEIPPLQYEKLAPVTPWVGQKFCPANSTLQQQRSTCVQKYREGLKNNDSEIVALKKDKYDKEQRTEIIITVKKKTGDNTTDCLTGIKIRVYVPAHECQNAEFFIFANNTLLYNSVGGMTANLNNADTDRGIPKVSSEPTLTANVLNPGYGNLKNGDKSYAGYGYGKRNDEGDLGGGRSDTFIITEEQSRAIIESGKGFINLWMVGTTSDVHQDIPVVQISKPGAQQYIYNGKPKIVQGLLLRLDACADKVIAEGTSETVPNVSSYRQILIDERVKLMEYLDLKDVKSEINNKLKNMSPKERAKVTKKFNLDGKGLLLERVNDLVSAMEGLVAQLKVIPANQWTAGSEVENLITSQYSVFYQGLMGDPSLYKDPNTGQYVDKIVNSNEFFGDVRMLMDRFYNGFNAIYLNNGQYSPKGILNDAGQLDGQTILDNLKQS